MDDTTLPTPRPQSSGMPSLMTLGADARPPTPSGNAQAPWTPQLGGTATLPMPVLSPEAAMQLVLRLLTR